MGMLARIARRLVAVLGRQLFNLWVNGFIASGLVPDHLRWVLLRVSGIRVSRSLIDARGFIGSRRIVIGRGSSINRGVFLDGSAAVLIGRNVSLGMNVLVVTGSHDLGGPDKRAGQMTRQPVRIEDGAWVGANSVVLPGITIGRGAVVGAASLVMKDVAPGTVVMGNPARVVRRLDGAEEATEDTRPAEAEAAP